MARPWTLQCKPEGLNLRLALPACGASGRDACPLYDAALPVLPTLLGAMQDVEDGLSEPVGSWQRSHAGLVTQYTV